MKDSKYIEFEKEIRKKFEDKGWETQIIKKDPIYADFALFFSGKLMGYVDTFMFKNERLNERLLLKKIKRDLNFIKEKKPLLFIITDGISYHISACGEPFEEQHYAPGPYDYITIKGMISEYCDFIIAKQKGEE